MHTLALIVIILSMVSFSSSAACPSYKYWDSGSSSCLICSYSCLTCTSSTDCTSCDTVNDFRTLSNQKACLCLQGYYDDRTTTVCKTCTSRISNCADCFYNSTYSAADAGLGARQYGCFSCRSGYVLQSNTCVAYVTCPAGQGANSVTNVCEACQTGCLTCTLSNRCTACDNTTNYFLNSATSTCILCDLFGCTSCLSLTVCQTCSAGLHLVNRACQCPDGQFYDPNAVACKNCSKYCLTCTGPSSYECTTCNTTQNRLLVGHDCQCDGYNYRESVTGPDCQKVNTNICERGYVKIQTTNQCVQICGDGWRINYECDDGGVVNTDGCSDACKIEPGFVCLNLGTAASICRLKLQVQFDSVKVTKEKKENVLKFEIDISPDSVTYYNYIMAEILHFRGGLITITQASYQNGKLYITSTYSRDLEGKEVQLQVKQDYYFDQNYPQNYQTIYNTSKATFTLSSQKIPLQTSNNLKPNFYTEQTYSQVSRTSTASLAIMIIMYIALLGSLIIKNSLSVVVNINALQICYVSLVTVDGMHAVTTGLLDLRPIMGYSNLGMFELSGPAKSVRVQSVGYVQDFANNFNVMFFIQAGFLVGSVLTSLAAHKKPMIKLASNFLQREALLLTIFNLPTVYFTITLMIKPLVLNIAFSAAAGILIIYQVIHLLLKGKDYFGFKEVFDFSDKGHFKKFIVVYFLARLGTCLSFSFINVQPLKSLIAGAAFEGAFILFISFARPFYHSLNNIFMILAQIMAICFFGCIYASEAVDTFAQAERDRSIDVMIYVVGAIMVVTIANLLYSLIIDIKEGGKKLKAFNQLVEAKNRSDQPV